MKKIFFLVVIVFLAFYSGKAQQRYAFVDTKYILEKMPDYTNAKEQLEKLSQQWQEEIEGINAEIIQLHSKFKADEVFLSADMRARIKRSCNCIS
jgi:outer membrane protein